MAEKYAIFHISGGIGKNIAATAVASAIKKNHSDRDLIVVSSWPDIWLHNPEISRVYKLGNTPWFYRDFILDKDTVVFAHEPYLSTQHIKKQTHLIETWCSLCNVDYSGEKPRLDFNFREFETTPIFKFNDSKPCLLIQPFGGMKSNDQQHPYSWARDIHPVVIQDIVNVLRDKFNIIHICYDYHPVIQGVTRFDKPIPKLQLMALLGMVQKRLLIDSSLQHAAAAMNLPSTVVWVATNPNIFGYGLHTNIVPPNPKLQGNVDSYLYDYAFDGKPHECPYKEITEMFDVNGIINGIINDIIK